MVYIVHAVGTDLYKIGYGVDAIKRIEGLQTGCPHELNVVKIYDDYDMVKERKLHDQYKEYRVRGEWFCFTAEEINRFFNNDYDSRNNEYSYEQVLQIKYQLRSLNHEKIKHETDINNKIKAISKISNKKASDIIVNDPLIRAFVFYLCLYVLEEGREGDTFEEDIRKYMNTSNYYLKFCYVYLKKTSLKLKFIEYLILNSELSLFDNYNFYLNIEKCQEFVDKYEGD